MKQVQDSDLQASFEQFFRTPTGQSHTEQGGATFDDWIPLVAEHREEFFRELAGPIMQCLEGVESVFLAFQWFSVLARGASIADIERYVLVGDNELPFQGAEEAMLDMLLLDIAGRDNEHADTARLVVAVAVLVEKVMKTLAPYECGGSPATTTASSCEVCHG